MESLSHRTTRFLSVIDRFLDRGLFAPVAVLVILGFAAYFNAIDLPFVHDDVVFVRQNPNIQRWDNIGEAFFRPAIPQFFQGLVTPYYRPVLEVIYRLQYLLFGFHPWGYHFFNIVIHIFNGLLFYGILRCISGAPKISFLAAAIFLVHPVQTEAVTCVSGISNVMCAFFMLLAFDGYLRRKEGQFWFIYALLMFAAALLTKEQAVMLPFIVVCYDLFLAKDRRVAAMLIRWSIFGLLLLGYLGLRHVLFGPLTTAVFENTAELKLRLLSLPRLLGMYGGLVVFPVNLHYYRSIDILAPNGLSWFLLALIAVMIRRGMTFLSTDGRRLIGFGLGWFILALFPVLNIVPLVNEYSFLAAGEHNLYFPMIGFLIALSAVAIAITPRLSNLQMTLAKTSGVLLITALIMASMIQNHFWQSESILFQQAARFEPQLGRVRILLAKAYFRNREFVYAIKEFRQAAHIMNHYVEKSVSDKGTRFYQGMLKGIYSDSAQAYAAIKDFDASIEQYNRALLLDPSDSFLYSNRALSFIAQKNMSSGIKDLETALSLDANNLYAANNLSICLIQKGDLLRARDILQGILSKDPSFLAARDNLNRLQSQVADIKK